jgi:hypothetical protein
MTIVGLLQREMASHCASTRFASFVLFDLAQKMQSYFNAVTTDLS